MGFLVGSQLILKADGIFGAIWAPAEFWAPGLVSSISWLSRSLVNVCWTKEGIGCVEAWDFARGESEVFAKKDLPALGAGKYLDVEKECCDRLGCQPGVADMLRLSLEALSNLRIGKEYL